MRPILTVTLNPAVDLAAATPQVVAGPKLRLGKPAIDPGGGGINVARAVRLLGGEALAFVALGGAMGAQLAWLVQRTGVPLVGFEAPGETRHSLTVTAEDSGAEYRFVLPGADGIKNSLFGRSRGVQAPEPPPQPQNLPLFPLGP